MPVCKFNPAGIDDCEDIEQYEPGGFHPVSLDDQYDGNRNQVVNKLGAGGFSTVWLARDLQAGRWVGLKFIVAAESEGYDARSSAILEDPVLASSESVLNTERRFWVDGPNGRHLCIVLPLVGPNLASQQYPVEYVPESSRLWCPICHVRQHREWLCSIHATSAMEVCFRHSMNAS